MKTWIHSGKIISFSIILGITSFTISRGVGQEEVEQKEITTQTIMKQMRWSLGDTDWSFGVTLPLETIMEYSSQELEELLRKEVRTGHGSDSHRTRLHRTIEALILQENEAYKERAKEILLKLIEIHGVEDINTIVTTHGIEYPGVLKRYESGGVHEATEPNMQRPTVLNVRDLSYEYAMLYLVTGDTTYAKKSRTILLRFAEVIPEWPLYDRDNKPHTQDEEKYLQYGAANGIWAIWSPLDLLESRPALRAFDIIRPSLNEEDIAKIKKGFFTHQKDLSDRLTYQLENYSNLMGYHLQGLILFGRVLDEPNYVHEAVGYIGNLLKYSFTPDGFWKEITPSYHLQVIARLSGTCALAAKGYSDPEGYTYKDGTRFDNLDIPQFFKIQFDQIERGQNVLAMPDRTYISLNDAWPKVKMSPEVDDAILDKPGLLGIGGVAKLGAEGMVAFLQFGGIRGHDQDTALNLDWFAGGREVFSETNYQALPDSGSSREWNTIAAGHNTVAVDESMSFRSPERIPEWITVPEQEEPTLEKPLVKNLPASATYANQGRLLLWNTNSSVAQVMEAERENAYPGVTSLFRRTVVMVPDGKGDGYLVDIFRIRGGKMHDYFLRGGLDQPYTMKFNSDLQPAEGTLYKYIQLKESAPVSLPLLATVQYEDQYEVNSWLNEAAQNENSVLQLFVGKAPAIRRLGQATFSLVRHQASQGKLETCYVWVHEAGKEKKIKSVRTQRDGMNVVVIIEREDRTDYIFSGEDDASEFSYEGWNFTGRLAFANADNGVVFSGSKLRKENTDIAQASPFVTGSVLKTTRREAHANEDSLLVKLDSTTDGLQPYLVHIDFGTFIRFSIPVKKVTKEGEDLRLELTHSPGFEVAEGKAVMTNSPGWAYLGVPTVRIDCITATNK